MVSHHFLLMRVSSLVQVEALYFYIIKGHILQILALQ